MLETGLLPTLKSVASTLFTMFIPSTDVTMEIIRSEKLLHWTRYSGGCCQKFMCSRIRFQKSQEVAAGVSRLSFFIPAQSYRTDHASKGIRRLGAPSLSMAMSLVYHHAISSL